MNYCDDLNQRVKVIKEVKNWVNQPDLEQVEDYRTKMEDLGLTGKTTKEFQESADHELNLLSECRSKIATLGVNVELDENPGLGAGKVALGHVMHGENKMHLASFDHMKSAAEASDMNVVDILAITAEHEKLHIGLHPRRHAINRVITKVTGKAEDGHNAEEGAVSIYSKSRQFDDYEDEQELVGEIASEIEVDKDNLIHWIAKGKVEKIEEAANDAGYDQLKETG